MKWIKNSLRIQLLIGFLCLSVVPITILGIISFNSSRKIIIQDVQTHLESVAILKKHAITKWTDHLQNSLGMYTQNDFIAEHVQQLSKAREGSFYYQHSHEILTKYLQDNLSTGYITHISILDKDNGAIILSSSPSWVGKIKVTSDFFIEGRQRNYISEIFVSLSMGKPTMTVSGPLKDQQDQIVGVIVLHADISHLSSIMLERTGLSKTTETFVVNKSNLLITNTVFAPNGAFKKWIFGEGAVRAISGESGVDVFWDYRDKKVLGAYLWLPERKLALIAKQDVAEAFAPIVNLGKKVLFFVLLTALTAGVVAFIAGRKIVDAIQDLVIGAETLGRGDLSFRIESTRQDEIGQLAHSFDRMALNLENITISLDEKEVLLREIHHRVKNNLQMVQSLLSLQITQSTSLELKEPLKDSMHRITSIAMVHETLYRANDLSTVDLHSYFNDLINYLLKSINPAHSQIRIDLQLQDIAINLDIVISCGLIINELVTNSLKYAFTEKQSGIIQIILKQIDEDMLQLTFSDNGVGINNLDSITKRNTLGVDLVYILAENQLEGEVQMISKNGLKYIITFPKSSQG